MSRNDREDALAQLTQVLDIYGARRERWPEDLRARLNALIEEDAEAARLLAEARALDKLLGTAAPAGDTAGLEARILAAAAGLPQTGAQVLPLEAHRRQSQVSALPVRAAQQSSARRIWPELALLAASLFLGLLIGLSGQAIPALQNIAVVADGEGGLGTFAGLLFDPDGAPREGAL